MRIDGIRLVRKNGLKYNGYDGKKMPATLGYRQ